MPKTDFNVHFAGTKEELVQRARDILAGRIPPPPIPTRDEELLSGPYVVMPNRPRWVEDSFNLQYYYGGHTVACYTSPDGILVVLACGYEEIKMLDEGLTGEEQRKIIIDFPAPPIVWTEVPPEDRTPEPALDSLESKEPVHVGSAQRSTTDNPCTTQSRVDPATI